METGKQHLSPEFHGMYERKTVKLEQSKRVNVDQI